MKISKKVSPFFLAIVFMMYSCGLDDGVDGVEPPNFDVLGLWDLVEVNLSDAVDIDLDGNSSSNLMDELDCISGTLLIDGDLVWTYEQTDISITPITGNQFNAICTDTISATGTWFSDETEVTFDGGDNALDRLRISNNQLVNDVGQDLPGIQSFVYELRQF